jgi:histidine triad (HIT) family protein
MEACVFCRVVAGSIPAAKLVETDSVTSFLDINPVNPGHALVVPKRHVTSFLDLTDEELQAAILVARRVAAAVRGATASSAFNLLQNDGRAAGQVVEHVHFHVIPRHYGDGFAFGWRQLSYKEGELSALQQAVRERL